MIAHADPPEFAAWDSGAAIPAPDGNGTWMVATTIARNGLWRISVSGEIEDVSERFGLERAGGLAAGLEIAASKSRFAVSGLGSFAVSDGSQMLRFDHPTESRVAVARGKVADASGNAIEVLDLERKERTSYALAGPVERIEYLDADSTSPRLVVQTHTALFLEDHGRLKRIAVSGPVFAIAASGSRLWIATAHGLGTLVNDVWAPTTVTDRLDHVTLSPSPTGDVWLADPSTVVRYAISTRTIARARRRLRLASEHRAGVPARLRPLPPPGRRRRHRSVECRGVGRREERAQRSRARHQDDAAGGHRDVRRRPARRSKLG